MKREERRTGEERAGDRHSASCEKEKYKFIDTHTHTHNTLTYTDSNTAICNEEMLSNPICVIVEVLNKAICNEEMLANPLCVIVEILSKATEISHVS